MIISASRRTDIPAFYAEWFMNRIREGFVDVRNPMNFHQISRVSLSPEVVDCIVFWTKNPRNLIKHLDELSAYKYYFQFTLTGYGRDVEQFVPDKKKMIIPTFCELSEKIGKEKVIWRYDPILINDTYTVAYHVKAFQQIAEALDGYTQKAVISFVDLYQKTKRNTDCLQIQNLDNAGKLALAGELVQIAREHDMIVESCAESIDLSSVGVEHGCCIDRKMIEKITGGKLQGGKDKNQRQECGCFESIDIGNYDTCRNGCRYCYANFNENAVKNNTVAYRPDATILCGEIGPEDKVTERKVKSILDPQISLFDVN